MSDVDSFDDRMGKDEQMLNAQLVRSHDLHNYITISLLMCMQSLEGHRWTFFKNQKYSFISNIWRRYIFRLDSGSDVVLQRNRAEEPEDIYPPIIIDNDNDSDVDVSGIPLDKDRNSHLRESLQSLKNLQTSNNVPPKELEKLLRRIEYLENLV